MKNFFLLIKLLAIIAVIGSRFYYGPITMITGSLDGLIVYAIWRANADPL
jgi:hypothetical protein